MEYLKVDLGCGSNKKIGTVGIDYIAYPGVDYVLNLEKDSLPFPDSSVDYVYSSHFLEQIDDPSQLFREVSRICINKAQLEFWTPYTWENSAFIFGHKKFYNEDDYMHLCVWFPHFWENNLKARWLLKEFVYTIEPKVLIDLYQNGIQLDFAIKYYKGVVKEFGAIMEVRHNYQGEILQPQYSFSTNRLAQRYPIQSLSLNFKENEDDLAEAINWFQMKQESLQTKLHPNQILLARSQSQPDETEVQPDQGQITNSNPQPVKGENPTHEQHEILLPQLQKIQTNLNKSQSWLQDIQVGLTQKQLKIQQAQERVQKKSFSLQSLVKFAFISGCPAASYIYRCHHQAEMLRLAGCEVEIYMTCTFPYDELIAKKYPIVVAHRIARTDEFENFVVQAHALGMKIIYELDDLIFDVDRLHQVDLYNNFDIEEKKIFVDQVKRNRQAIELCDGVVVSTNRLEEEIRINFPGIPVIISRNRISQKMEEEAIQARLREIPKDKFIRIAYFSGTKSHQKDFAECVDGLYNILQEFPDVRLMIVGYLDIPKSLHEFSAQIEMLPFVDPSELPYLYRKVDINLAPLESKNDFTECKSELKYFEAGLLGVPTVASGTSGFQLAIKNGFNGHLCSSTREWTDTLRELVTNPELRGKIGQIALEDVNARYLTRVAAYETLEAWQNLFNKIGL